MESQILLHLGTEPKLSKCWRTWNSEQCYRRWRRSKGTSLLASNPDHQLFGFSNISEKPGRENGSFPAKSLGVTFWDGYTEWHWISAAIFSCIDETHETGENISALSAHHFSLWAFFWLCVLNSCPVMRSLVAVKWWFNVPKWGESQRGLRIY